MSQTAAHLVDARTLRPLQAAAITCRIAFGPRAGQKVLTLRGSVPREGWSRQPLCAGIDRFSLHAAVRVQAHDRKRLEQLCCCITRPALSDERIQKIIAAILERPVIEKILAHLGLDPQPRPGAGRARRGKTAAA